MRDPLRRLDLAFVAFFRRVEAGAKPGYPRFRSARRYDSLTWASGFGVRACRLALQGIGHVKVKWHRPLPASAMVRTVTVRRVAGRWFACFSLKVSRSSQVAAAGKPAVGLDLGVLHFATLSTGEQVPGPRAYRAAIRTLRVAQRRLCRRRKGSHRRRKAALLLARHHERMATLSPLQELFLQLKAAREAKGLSLADLTELTGMDRSALSKLETGQRANPTVETLVRYAEAVGKRLVVSLTDV